MGALWRDSHSTASTLEEHGTVGWDTAATLETRGTHGSVPEPCLRLLFIYFFVGIRGKTAWVTLFHVLWLVVVVVCPTGDRVPVQINLISMGVFMRYAGRRGGRNA